MSGAASAYVFKPHERPTLPGSPANPEHPIGRRTGYLLAAILVGMTGGLGSALLTVNLPFVQGTLGLSPAEGAWLLAAYYMTNVTANLLLIKYRQQFGLQPFVRYVLATYALATFAHLFIHDFWSTLAVRAISGLAASSQDAGIANAQAQLVRAQADMQRADALVADGSISARERDQTRAALLQAQAALAQARSARLIGEQDIRSVQVGRGGLRAGVEGAAAQLRLARIDLDNTVIRAPVAGQLSEIGVRRGAFVTAGTQLMFLVPRANWIIANFKEAQTRDMRAGQRAIFTVDALGGAELTGRIESMAPAAGSEFAVLKPDNATGNFVKVAQRIAVRIGIDESQALAVRLRPGMSVDVRIATRQ